MTFFEEWRQIILSAFRNRTRTLLTAFGVFWGIFMVVLLMGIGKGVEHGVQSMFKDDAINSVWVSGDKTSIAVDGFVAGRPIKLSLSDMELIGKAIPGIESLTPRLSVHLKQSIRYGNKQAGFPVYGVYPGYHDIERNQPLQGRLLNWKDITDNRRIAVIGKNVAERLFNLEETIVGENIVIEGISFKVVGVFNDEGGETENRRIYLPYTTVQRSFDSADKLDYIAFTITGIEPQTLAEEIKRVMGKKHNFDPNDPSAIYVFNAYEEYQRIESLFLGINIFIIIVGIGSLFAGLVSVSNVMMISIKERKREIGLRKALGATPSSIQMLVVKEALLISTVAGYLGLMAGVGLIELLQVIDIRATFFQDPEVNLGIAFSALVAIIVGGSLSGFIPAKQAARTSPIEALRHD